VAGGSAGHRQHHQQGGERQAVFHPKNAAPAEIYRTI